MAEPVLDDYERELVRFFAQRYLDHRQHVMLDELPGRDFAGGKRTLPAIERIIEAKLIEPFTTSSVMALPDCVELVRRWDNPPVRDRWEETTKWFRSKAWSLPVLVLAVGLPAIVTWIGMVRTVLEWFGAVHGSGK